MNEKLTYIQHLLDNLYKCTSHNIKQADNINLSIITLIFTNSDHDTKKIDIYRKELPRINMLFEENNQPYVFLVPPCNRVIRM